MKIAHSSYKLHAVKREGFGLPAILELFTAPEHLYPGQRDHHKTLKNRKHVKGELRGDSRRFVAAYVLDEKKLMGLDGYHRAASVAAGTGFFPKDQQPFVDTYVVQTMEDANALFEQFNSLAAAKKSSCWFTSGLRASGVLSRITSKLVWRKGKATAAQLAAGKLGSDFTKEATMAVVDGIVAVDQFQLTPRKHELAGVIGAYYAIAQHCKDATLVETFVRSVNQVVFKPSAPTIADGYITLYRNELLEIGSTGGAPNAFAFHHGLFAFLRFAYAKKRKAVPITVEEMNITVFKQLMSVL